MSPELFKVARGVVMDLDCFTLNVADFTQLGEYDGDTFPAVRSVTESNLVLKRTNNGFSVYEVRPINEQQ